MDRQCNGVIIIAETDGIPPEPDYSRCRNPASFIYCDLGYCKYCIPKPLNGICQNIIKIDGINSTCTNITDTLGKHCMSCRRYENLNKM